MNTTVDPILAPDPGTPFENLPPALRREVLGRINRWVAIIVGVTVIGCLLLIATIKIGIEAPRAGELGLLVVAMMVACILPIAGGMYLLALGAGGWSSMLTGNRLATLYGIDRSEMTNVAMARRKGSISGLWYGLVGLVVISGLVALCGLLVKSITGSTIGTHAGIILGSGSLGLQVMARAWRIRHVVADHRALAV